MIVLRNFLNIFFIPELRKKIFFTLGILIIWAIGRHIPVIGVDVNQLQLMVKQGGTLGGLLQYLDLFSGGMLTSCTIFALGIMPYITASIMMQILGMAIPYLEQLLKEGEYGRKIVNQYTRYLAVFVAFMQSIAYISILQRMNLVLEPGLAFNIILIVSLVVGSIIVMWFGEQISLFGLGNGSSMIIFAGIVSTFPGNFIRTVNAVQQGMIGFPVAILILAIIVGITGCIVFLEKGQRKIPVQYARRVVGQKVYGGQSTYIPFKINSAGVMPVILTGTIMQIPIFLLSALSAAFSQVVFLRHLTQAFQSGPLFYASQFVLIIGFSFLYTALIYNPEELADNIKKSGGFIPGIRPGKKTAEFFNYILTRLGLIGAIYLGILAISPGILQIFITMPFILRGTSLLIVVGVALETAALIESYLIEHRYEGFLTKGRLKGRGAR